MKKFIEFIKESKSDINKLINLINTDNIYDLKDFLKKVKMDDEDDLGRCLVYAARCGNLDIFKLIFNQPGIDINIQDDAENTALIDAAFFDNKEIVKFLLVQKDIDVEIKGCDDINFIENLAVRIEDMGKEPIDPSFLIDYEMQKKILENDREDILIFFNKYGLVHPKIKEEHPDLFTAKDWGLI